MEEAGVVSVWIGTADDQACWDRAIETSTAEAGGFLDSEFSRAFGVARHDSDYQEAQFYPHGRSRLGMLLPHVPG